MGLPGIEGVRGIYNGYHDCPCRDCFEIAIGGEDEAETRPALCNECEQAGCTADGASECEREPELEEEDSSGVQDVG